MLLKYRWILPRIFDRKEYYFTMVSKHTLQSYILVVHCHVCGHSLN